MPKNRYQGAQTLDEYIAGTEKNHDLWVALRRRARVPAEVVRRVEAIPGRWHLLVLSEDWCGDAVNTVPVVGALADAASNLDLRVVSRDENPDLMDTHLSPRGARAIPVIIVLDEQHRELGWWGSRPAALQAWVMGEGMALPPEDRYREVRRWYARDAGATTLAEMVALLEEAAERRETAAA